MAPGYYILTVDIDTSGAACMNIHDTQSVTLDCNGHRIMADNGFTPLMVQNVTAFALTNCSVTNQGTTVSGTVTAYGLDIETGADIALTYNNIAGIKVYNVSRGDVSNNQIVGYYEQFNSHEVTISQNTVVAVADELFLLAGIELDEGHNNQVLKNAMDGKWNGMTFDNLLKFTGWQQGILLSKEAGDLISENDIQNVWDAGIGAIYSLVNTTISMNSIHHTLGSAIEVSSYIDWQGNQVLNNQSDDVAELLTIRYTEQAGFPAPPTVHFENNYFVGNGVAHVSGTDFFHYGSRSEITIKPVESVQLLVDNNVLEDNNFGQYAPALTPAKGFIDGGGNVCQTATDGSPITCHP